MKRLIVFEHVTTANTDDVVVFAVVNVELAPVSGVNMICFCIGIPLLDHALLFVVVVAIHYESLQLIVVGILRFPVNLVPSLLILRPCAVVSNYLFIVLALRRNVRPGIAILGAQ